MIIYHFFVASLCENFFLYGQLLALTAGTEYLDDIIQLPPSDGAATPSPL